jgi:hypothetical protein
MLPPIPPDFVARGDGCGAAAYRPCRDAFEPDDGCCPLSRRLGDGPDQPGQGVYPVARAAAGRGADASQRGSGGVGPCGPCLPRLRLIFPALLRPALEWPALKSPPPLQSPSGDSAGCGDSEGPACSESAGPALPRKRHAAEWAEEDRRRAKVGGSVFAPGLRPLPTGRPHAAASGEGNEDLAAEAGHGGGGGQAGSLAMAGADPGQSILPAALTPRWYPP